MAFMLSHCNRGKNMQFRKKISSSGYRTAILKNWVLYLFLLPAVIYIVIFHYVPMYGLLTAFKNYKPRLGIWGSPWAKNNGFYHFLRFFRLHNFWVLIRNTSVISLYSIFVGFPLPVILALMLNCSENQYIKKTNQFVTYAPHFISTVVVVSIINVIFSPRLGIVVSVLRNLGLLKGYLNVLTSASVFPHLYVWSGIWSNVGWNSIIYLAALSSVDNQLYEAAMIDGASRLKRIWYVDLPEIIPTLVTMFILRIGNIFSTGFEKAFLMQNALNLETSEVLSTYVYKVGIVDQQYSFSTVVGLFNSVVNIVFLLIFNAISKKVADMSLF